MCIHVKCHVFFWFNETFLCQCKFYTKVLCYTVGLLFVVYPFRLFYICNSFLLQGIDSCITLLFLYQKPFSVAVPPCRQKCCKVRFKPTIEVRERMGSDCRRTALRRSTGDDEPIKPLSVWKVMGVAFIFGILVRVCSIKSG